jgi:ParB family chromosome partitioning protein
MDTVQAIKVKDLVESKTNPRRDPGNIKDLAASIKQDGVLCPLLVRKIDKGYEIVTGSRRHKAAIEAGLTEVPAIVKELTDDDVIRIQIVENLQREGVNPLDEAKAFEKLLASVNGDMREAMRCTGKSGPYITRIMALNNLTPKVRKLVEKGKVSINGALNVCRLPTEKQDSLSEWDLNNPDRRSTPDNDLAKSKIPIGELVPLPQGHGGEVPTLPMRLEPCSGCEFNTGRDRLLFSDMGGGKCVNNTCFETKRFAALMAIAKKKGLVPVVAMTKDDNHEQGIGKILADHYPHLPLAGQWSLIRNKTDSCEHAKKGIVVHKCTYQYGFGEPGEQVAVCVEPTCEVHHRITKSGRVDPERAKWIKKQHENKAAYAGMVSAGVVALDKINTLTPDLVDYLTSRIIAAFYFDAALSACKNLGLDVGKGEKRNAYQPLKDYVYRQSVKGEKPDPLTILKRCAMICTAGFNGDKERGVLYKSVDFDEDKAAADALKAYRESHPAKKPKPKAKAAK